MIWQECWRYQSDVADKMRARKTEAVLVDTAARANRWEEKEKEKGRTDTGALMYRETLWVARGIKFFVFMKNDIGS
jgi:hypothetical protein